MIKENLHEVRKKIEEAVKKSGRKTEEVTLIAVSKTFPMESVLEAYSLGQRDFGENRVQEAKYKMENIDKDIKWHLIGHLQTNKAKMAARLFDVIHSVDSLRLARMLDEYAGKAGRELDIFLQVNIAKEEQKSGVTEDETLDSVKEIMKLKHLNLIGLMNIPPYTTDKEETRWYYKRLRELKESVNESLGENILKELSMGMTNDYEVAVEEGATYLRIGTAIFGKRAAPHNRE